MLGGGGVAQLRLREVEEQLARSVCEAEMLRTAKAELEQRLVGAKTRGEVDELLRRLDAAEAAAAEKRNDYTSLCCRVEVRGSAARPTDATGAVSRDGQRSQQGGLCSCCGPGCLCAQEAERKLEQALRDRQKHLAQITNLRAALRDVSSYRETAAVVGKLHEQLDHALSKESLARNALNRSELHRFESDKDLRRTQADLTTVEARSAASHEQARWACRSWLALSAVWPPAAAGVAPPASR